MSKSTCSAPRSAGIDPAVSATREPKSSLLPVRVVSTTDDGRSAAPSQVKAPATKGESPDTIDQRPDASTACDSRARTRPPPQGVLSTPAKNVPTSGAAAQTPSEPQPSGLQSSPRVGTTANGRAEYGRSTSADATSSAAIAGDRALAAGGGLEKGADAPSEGQPPAPPVSASVSGLNAQPIDAGASAHVAKNTSEPRDPSECGDAIDALLRKLEQTPTLKREAGLKELVSLVVEREKRDREHRGSEAQQREETIKKRLIKAGYEYDPQMLLDVTSLLDAPTFRNFSVSYLRHRRQDRIKQPNLKLPRVVGLFETNVYLGDRALRATEALTQDKQSLLRASSGNSVRASIRSSLSSGVTSKHLCKDAAATCRRTDSAGLPAPVSDPFSRQLTRDELVLPEMSRHKKQGFTRQFTAMATGLSFFPVDRLAKIAANDFLRNPTLMMPAYLEWGAAMSALARSGQLSLSASKVLADVSRALLVVTAIRPRPTCHTHARPLLLTLCVLACVLRRATLWHRCPPRASTTLMPSTPRSTRMASIAAIRSHRPPAEQHCRPRPLQPRVPPRAVRANAATRIHPSCDQA